ncbi:MAG: ORF6N domain-containing protein [Elusimicrobia bacterium]|nr:ORF6N domain-containing protein [Elusimicrobiota bacterium]
MLDADLAEVYGVATKRLNEQVRRNRERFPEDFVFRLTAREAQSVLRSRSQSATLKLWGSAPRPTSRPSA